MKPLVVLFAGTLLALSAGAATAEPAFGRGGIGRGGLPGPHGMVRPGWDGRHGFRRFGGFGCCAPGIAVWGGSVFPGWTAFQAPSAFGESPGYAPGPAAIVNVTVNLPAVATVATLPTAGDLPQVAGLSREAPAPPVLYVVNDGAAPRGSGPRIIEITPDSAQHGTGFGSESPFAPRIIELQAK